MGCQDIGCFLAKIKIDGPKLRRLKGCCKIFSISVNVETAIIFFKKVDLMFDTDNFSMIVNPAVLSCSVISSGWELTKGRVLFFICLLLLLSIGKISNGKVKLPLINSFM